MSHNLTPAAFRDLADDALVRVRQIVPQFVPVSEATFWRMVKTGKFPSPIRPSPGVTAWRVGALRLWSQASPNVPAPPRKPRGRPAVEA